MSIRSKLFATVALPVFAASLAIQPALADSLNAPFEVAQEEGGELTPEELLLLKKREEEQRRAAEEEQQRAAEEEKQRQAEEQQRAAEEEQQRAAEEEKQRQAEEQQRAAEEEQQRAAEEEQRRAAEEEQQRAAEEEQRRAAEEEQQRAAEEEQRRAAEEEQQRAAEEEQRRAAEEEQQRAAEEEQRRAAEEEQQRAAEEEKQRQAEEQQRAAEEEQQRQAEEQQRAAEEEQRAVEEQRVEEPSAPVDEEQAAEPPAAPEDETTAEQPATEGPAEQTGEAQPVPEAEEPATAEQLQGEPEAQPAPEVVDERTEEEKLKIAEDPAATDETVVLPVEGGAPVLDSDKDADNAGGNQAREVLRQQREALRAQEESVTPPTDDAAAQAEMPAEIREAFPQKMEAALSEEGARVEAVPTFAVPETTNIVNNTVINNTVINNTVNNTTTTNITEIKVVEEVDNRVILEAGDRIFVRGDDRQRLRYDAEESFYEELPRDRYRETIVRPGGYRIVTIYNRYGDILQRTRIDSDGNEYVLIYAPEYEDRRRPAIVDVGYDLPPMRLAIPVNEYIVDYADDPDRDYYEFLAEPPVERVERVYTIDEVRHSARLRDKVRRVDLDTINFATGSAEVSMSQAKTLRKVADAMSKILDRDPGETFFIEGHTDAVGSDRSNLILSDRRAESVAVLLTEVYGIPAENLVTQGYGERFLKIRTQAAEQENRRVTIRRVTPLVRPVAQR